MLGSKHKFLIPNLKFTIIVRSGFTLIELLIAVAIFSVVSLSVYQVFNAGIFSYRRLNKELKLHQTVDRVFRRMTRDLENSFIFSRKESRFIGANDQVSFFSLVGGVYTKVIYKINENKITRICQKNTDSLKEDLLQTSRVIVDNIEEGYFRYALPADNENGFSWQDTWGKTDEEKLAMPLAVNLKIIIKDPVTKEIKNVEFEKTIFLPAKS